MDFSPVLMALIFIWNVGLTIVGFARRPGDDAIKAAQKSHDELQSLSGRVQALETHMEHLPSSREVGELSGTARELRAMVEALQESVKSLRSTVELIDEFQRRASQR